MTEALSPNPKQRLLPGATRIQSPTSPFFLGSNDDKLERAQARAARAAKVRRSIVALPPRGASDPDNCLGKHQILDLFRNCIKLASENVCNNSLAIILLSLILNSEFHF
jgi:condensin complex subunit 2